MTATNKQLKAIYAIRYNTTGIKPVWNDFKDITFEEARKEISKATIKQLKSLI